MSTTRLGATKRYADNWENIFGGGKGKSAGKKGTATKAKKGSGKSAKQSAKSKTSTAGKGASKKRAGKAKKKGR